MKGFVGQREWVGVGGPTEEYRQISRERNYFCYLGKWGRWVGSGETDGGTGTVISGVAVVVNG